MRKSSKKKSVLLTLIIFILSLLASSIYANYPERLTNIENNFVVVEMSESQVVFHDPALEEKMEKEGVVIPPAEQKNYGGKEIVYLGDPMFNQAFKEYYYKFAFDQNLYHWESL